MDKRILFDPFCNKANEYETVCTLHKSQISIPNQLFFKKDLNNCHQRTSLYLTEKVNNRSKLIIYDTENEREVVKMLETSALLDSGTCIAQLPNDEIFCFGSYEPSGVTLIIDKKYEIRVLPSGFPCFWSSCIYFSNNVYCFGGINKIVGDLTLSMKFDLNMNRWINLTPMAETDYYCSSIIFHENILITGLNSRNLLLYSIDIDSFSIIPYEFEEYYRKILINADLLYLIEFDGFIYESEDEYSWKKKFKLYNK